jgi:hypothetical protein
LTARAVHQAVAPLVGGGAGATVSLRQRQSFVGPKIGVVRFVPPEILEGAVSGGRVGEPRSREDEKIKPCETNLEPTRWNREPFHEIFLISIYCNFDSFCTYLIPFYQLFFARPKTQITDPEALRKHVFQGILKKWGGGSKFRIL